LILYVTQNYRICKDIWYVFQVLILHIRIFVPKPFSEMGINTQSGDENSNLLKTGKSVAITVCLSLSTLVLNT